MDGIPILISKQIKYIDYAFYTTKVFSYEIERDNEGEVVTNSTGEVNIINFKTLKVARAGQNK